MVKFRFKIVQILSIFLVIFSVYSCTPSKYFKNYVYLSDSLKASHLVYNVPELHKLQVGDRIKINVTALNPTAAQQFNLQSDNTQLQSQTALSATGIINPEGIGYLIDKEGTIVFPQIGHVKVEGLTVDSVGKLLEGKLLTYLTNPAVSVSYVNFIVNVIGEVSHAGPINLQDGKNTILDVITKCGDLTTYGKRENVLVVRQNGGKREFGRLDLSSNNLFSSPYFYLQPGDIIYVDVNPNKLLGADTYQQRRFEIIGLTFSTISTVLLLINFFKK